MQNIAIATLAIALVPGWALAQNGVVPINQSTIAASGANRSTGGFPYVITQPGSYQLTSNLTLSGDVSAIVISASYVSLDLNGFTISNQSCHGACTGSGITDNGIQQYGISIRNGTVLGLYDGISLTATTGSFIEKVTAQSNRNIGIEVFNSSTVKDCVALSNLIGILAGRDGIVSGSVASGNFGYGISIVGTGTLTGNTANGNAGGIYVGVGNSTLTGNTASNNASLSGFLVASGSTLTGNTASADNTGFSVNCPSNLVGNTAVGDTTPETESGAGCNKVNNLGF